MVEESSDTKRGLLLVTLVLLAAMGPYLDPGIRTEQVGVYGFAAVALALFSITLRPPPLLIGVVIVWAVYLSVVVIGAADPPPNPSRYPSGEPLAGVDNALLPLAVIVISVALVRIGNAHRLLQRATGLVVALMCINAGAAFAQMRYGVEYPAWYGGDLGRESVSSLAAQLGRYSGFINQPAEAGVLYSVAALCAIYRLPRRPWLLAGALLVLTVGGVLTVSKIFLFAGLPLMALALLRTRRGRGIRLVALTMVCFGAGAALNAGFLPRWGGLDFLLRFVPGASDQSLVALLSANRYGAGGGTLSSVVDAVLSGPRWFGYGGGGLAVAYDSGWVEALVVAGLFGLVLHGVVFAVLIRAWKKAPRSPERTLLGYLLLVLIATDLGLPALTANRVATVVWLLLTLLMCATSVAQPPEVPDSRTSRRRVRPGQAPSVAKV